MSMPEKETEAIYRNTAEEQRETDILSRRYTSDTPIGQLPAVRELDREATGRATVRAVLIGTGGLLVMGTGLSMVLSLDMMAWGIVTGCCGIAIMAAMPAAYERLLKRERRRVAPRIGELLREAEQE